MKKFIMITFTGWYLMGPTVYPSQSPKGRWRWQPFSSISEWHVYKSFDYANQCENYKSVVQSIAKHHFEPAMVKYWDESICIASDDSRLNSSLDGSN